MIERYLLSMLLVLCLFAPVSFGAPNKKAKDKPAAHKLLTVAVLSFKADDAGQKDLGSIIGQTVAVMLSDQPGIRMVDRTSLNKVLAENQINLTGLVKSDQAIRVGHLVGAKILVTGQTFRLGDHIFMTAKLIGSETSLVDGVLVKGDLNAGLDQLVLKLANKIASHLRKKGPSLVAGPAPVDPLKAVANALAHKAKPTVAVVVQEQHRGRHQTDTQDPAAETEIKHVLQKCGFAIKDLKANQLDDWVAQEKGGGGGAWPRSLAGVDYVVTGKGFSEFGAQIGQLDTATAHVEINLIGRRHGKVLVSDQCNTRAVDLSDALAGRKALEKAGHSLGIQVLRYFVHHLPDQRQAKH